MKILYAIQGTGNGHISRAREISPHLQNYGELDQMVSGASLDMKFPYLIKYKRKGVGFTFGKKGSVDMLDSIKKLRPLNFVKDIYQFPVKEYDVIINDFEPVTAWACMLQRKACLSLSHQAAFLSPNTPRFESKNTVAETILKRYAPCSSHIGFHFQPYDHFIQTPVIRSQVRESLITNKGHITVYLPAYSDDKLIKFFTAIKEIEWQVFSKHARKDYRYENVSVRALHNDAFIGSLSAGNGLITNGGFESPAEAMFLGKKVMAIPMQNQYEQLCNAAAMKQMGVTVINKIDADFEIRLREWLSDADPVHVDYKDQLPEMMEQIFRSRSIEMLRAS